MADTLVSVLIEHLAGLAFERIEEEVRLFKNVKSDVKKLNSNLTSIRAVLDDAEKKQLSDASLKNWLNHLNDVFHEIDDVLDHWNSYILKSQIQKDGHEDPPTQPTKKVCLPKIPSPFSCFNSKVNKLTLRHDIARKIKELNVNLDAIAVEKDRFGLNKISVDRPVERPVTTSFIDETEIEGRDADKEVLVSKLMGESSSQQDKGLHVIPIVGIGGLGKTTLAQIAYKDEKVEAHFDLRIWVCVSDPFDEIRVAKGIVEAVDGSAPNIDGLETLLKCVHDRVGGKRFLLVLDDVWTEESEKWEKLKQPLKNGAAGSKIIVTSRKEEVAIMMDATDCMITLETLSEENCWSVFKRRAFSGRKDNECKQLEDIGRKIASRSKGLPLIAKSLGSLMRFKKTQAQWEEVFHSELWRLKDVDKIFAPFLLSYYDLSAVEKRCFSYCSIFPKDHRIDRDRLIEMWMSQDYLGRGTSLEEEGRECFDNLVMRSFFQNFERKEPGGSVTHCKMHDILHDFAQFVAENECVIVRAEKVAGEMSKASHEKVEDEISKLSLEKVRHLTMLVESKERLPIQDFTEINRRKLRTIFILANRHTITADGFSALSHLTCLRSLTLSRCGIEELPATIGRLIHMRYLDLSGNSGLKELPEDLCDLCNLKTLNLSFCVQLEGLPEGIGRLVNLRHLYIYPCPDLKGLPKGFGKLACLRSLDWLSVPEDKEKYFDIGQLKRLRNLQLRGSIFVSRCGNLRSRDEAEKVDLKSIGQHVDQFVLQFYEIGEVNGIFEEHGAVLDGLEPNQNLRKLSISNYNGSTLSPSWMMNLNNLREIEISRCPYCVTLPPLGKQPYLESAYIYNAHSLEKVGPEFLGVSESPPTSEIAAFPKLKHLQFINMFLWEKWEVKRVNDMTAIMPCLATLVFHRCSQLRELPDFLRKTTSLKEVIVISSQYIKETREAWDKISHAPNITINSNDVRKDGVWIQEER